MQNKIEEEKFSLGPPNPPFFYNYPWLNTNPKLVDFKLLRQQVDPVSDESHIRKFRHKFRGPMPDRFLLVRHKLVSPSSVFLYIDKFTYIYAKRSIFIGGVHVRWIISSPVGCDLTSTFSRGYTHNYRMSARVLWKDQVMILLVRLWCSIILPLHLFLVRVLQKILLK
jgi:hypothetical protein